MTKDPVVLNKECKTKCSMRRTKMARKKYWPTEDGVTYCNLATQDVLSRLGYPALKGFSADGIVRFTSRLLTTG